MATVHAADRSATQVPRRVLFLKTLGALVGTHVLLTVGRTVTGAWRGEDVALPLGEVVIGAGVATGLWIANPWIVAIARGLFMAWSFVLAALAVTALIPGIAFSVENQRLGWGARAFVSVVLLAMATLFWWVGRRVLRPVAPPTDVGPPGADR